MGALAKCKDETGAVTIIIAISLTAFILSLAVVVDMGLIYQERRQLQTATDAAALAAAMDIAEGMGFAAAEQKAIEYVSENANVPVSSVSVAVPAANQVSVTAATERSLFFAAAAGMESAVIAARSIAALGSAAGVSKLVPFIVPMQRVAQHTGAENVGTFELGQDRPLDAFSKIQDVSGDTITYTITYNNTGTKIEDITVRDPIPDGTVYVSGSATSGGVYNASNKEVTWSISGIMPGDYRIMKFSVKVTSGSVGSVGNTAYLTTSSTGKTTTASVGDGAQKGYFWLCDFNDGSGGVPDYDAWIRQGFPETVFAGHMANGVGVKASLKSALDWRKGFDSSIVVPVYSYTEGGGSVGSYHVAGFAEFVITGFNMDGNPKTITGYFTDGTVVSGVYGPTPSGYFGVDTVWLVE